jgi:hypothetical protein
MDDHTPPPGPVLFPGARAAATAKDAEQPGSSTTDTRLRGSKKRSKIPRLKRWDYVRVSWLDAVKFEGDQHSRTDFQCATRHSIGHFIKRSKHAITIAMEDDRGIDDTSDCDNVTSIPIGMVLKTVILIEKPD